MAARRVYAPWKIAFLNFQRKTGLRCRFPHTRCLCSTDSASETNRVQEEEDEIQRIRDVSRLSASLKARVRQQMPTELKYDFQQTKRYKRKLYAKFGTSSGIDPGIMWPTKAEMMEKIRDEEEWSLSLEEMMRTVEERKRTAEESIKLREEMIEKKMSEMPMLIAEHHKRIAEQEEEMKRQELKKQKVLEEAREFFGYNVDIRDAKFQQMLEQKQMEERKAAKLKKKQQKMAQITARLQAMADESKENS